MSVERANDLRAFRDFADVVLAGGGGDLSLDEALDLWESENASPTEHEQTLKAIQRGLDDMNAGRTVDAFESAERLRLKIESIARR